MAFRNEQLVISQTASAISVKQMFFGCVLAWQSLKIAHNNTDYTGVAVDLMA